MHDESGAQVAPDGSSRSIMLADSGGVTAQPPALGYDYPDATPSPTVPEHDRPGASPSPTAPGYDHPDATPSPTVPEHDRPGASPSPSPTAPGYDHPDATPSPTVPEHDRPGASPSPTAPGYDHPDATPSPTVPEHDRPGASPSPTAPGYDCPGASYAAAPAHDRPRVTHPTPPGHTQASVTDPTAPGHDHPPVTDPTTPDQGLYGRTFTKEEVQRLVEAATVPLLDEEVRLLQVLIRRFVALGYDPTPPQDQPTVRQQQRTALIEKITVVGRAVDVLQRTLKTRQVLAADSPNELYQLLDEAAKYMDNPPPPEDLVIEEYDPCTRTVRPMREP